MLWLCLTGLPLIFHSEIDKIIEPAKQNSTRNNKIKQGIDEMLRIAERKNIGYKTRYIFWQDEKPGKTLLSLSKKPDDAPDKYINEEVDEKTGEFLGKFNEGGVMETILRLHTDMFAGTPGKLFLGLMGVLFLISIISGVVLYGPIMKNFDFGTVRKHKSKRIRRLDTHNLLGIAMLAWMSVVGFTGVINCFSDVLIFAWQKGQLAELTGNAATQKPLARLSSAEDALKTAQAKVQNMHPAILAFPGTQFSSARHYAIFFKGNTEVTSKLLKPVFINADSGTFLAAKNLPWYATMLFLSQPLHFGDYGGFGLKIVWAVYDIFSIVVLVTGIYLWLARRKSQKKAWRNLELKHQPA